MTSKDVGKGNDVSRKVYYTVKYGDSLSGIAVKYRTSTSKLKRWNRLDSDRIVVGQKLLIWSPL